MNRSLHHNYQRHDIFLLVLLIVLSRCSGNNNKAPNRIDREALVTRHNVVLTNADTLGSLSVGNGEFSFTADVSGLQTFPADYENGISLGTQSQWGWHRFIGEKYSLNDVEAAYVKCKGGKAPYAIQHTEGKAGDATKSLRMNPHRLHLGIVGLILLKENGKEVALNDLTNIHQHLNLWTGLLESSYQIEGVPVKVELYAHQQDDLISARVTSSLITQGRLAVRLRFPYGADCHTCAGYDWNHPEKHTSTIDSLFSNKAVIHRQLDSTDYYVHVAWNSDGALKKSAEEHEFVLISSTEANTLEFSIGFSEHPSGKPGPTFSITKESSTQGWKKFWSEGGAIDFSQCTDKRAHELERRVVLSQYLTRIQCAGSAPPQETGLTMNSWYGKFHLEMHWWHEAHFMLWSRPSLFEKSMPWYSTVLDKAKATARKQGYDGVRWQKMTSIAGDESPSNIGVFLIWQQPHPIYYAELFYRNDPRKETLEKYKDLVFATADFMASYATYSEQDKKYHLCSPVIPSQEIFKATETSDPAFELAYWHYGLAVAQQWRARMGLTKNERWQTVLDNLTALPVSNNLYLPVATVPNAYTDDQYRNDHPSVTAAFGFLPQTSMIDTATMRNTFHEIMSKWNWETTWGWDYPMLAMTATRLGESEKAIDALLMDVQKNTYLVNGHNYQDKRLRLYLPGNGGLLAAVALMAAGWDGNPVPDPGFPKNGKWNVRWEGLQAMP